MKTTQVKFYIQEVTQANLNNKGLEGYDVGDIAIFALNLNDEQAESIAFKHVEAHKVSESEAGTGIYAQAQAGDLGAIRPDNRFFTADELSELYMKQQENQELHGEGTRELNEDSLDSIVGGFKWNGVPPGGFIWP